MARDRRLTVHMVIPKLNVPQAWTVGDVTFRPLTWLDALIEKTPAATDSHLRFRDMALEDLRGHGEGTAASVEVLHPSDAKNNERALTIARDKIRDSIGILRLYQRSRVPLSNRSLQSFGLAADVTSVVEYSWITNSAGTLIQTGGRWRGSIGAWTFTPRDVHAYHRDTRFSLLDVAISAPTTDWHRRLSAALRTLAISSASLRPSLRIALCATALEALLGDPFVPGLQFDGRGKMQRQRPSGQQHLISRRSAYLTCRDSDDVAHHPRAGACPYMYERSFTSLREFQRKEGFSGGNPRICWAYEEVSDVFDDRNIALHGANDHYSEADAGRHESRTDRSILALTDWIIRTGSTDFADLNDEIAKMPRDSALPPT